MKWFNQSKKKSVVKVSLCVGGRVDLNSNKTKNKRNKTLFSVGVGIYNSKTF